MMEGLSALRLAALLKKREISTLDVLKLYEKEDSANCFITRDFAAAKQQAMAVQEKLDRGECTSPLAGIPLAVKDNLCTKGMKTTCASRMLENFVPPYDATVIQKVKAADMIILGKTNMDEFAMGSTGETSYFGAVKNPLDVTRCAGGSSSGSAAAVAGGLAPLALGTDTGGSVRQPAAYCGIYGLKPTYGAVSRYGLIAYASSLDTVGVLADNVGDLAALYQIIKGRDKKDATSFDSPNVLPDSSCQPRQYRVKTLEHLPLEEYAVAAYYILACAEAASNLARYDGVRFGRRSERAATLEELYVNSRTEGFGSEVKKRLLLGNYVLSAGYYEQYYLKALQVKALIKKEFDKLLSDCDFLIAPTVTGEAPRLGESLEHPLQMYQSDALTVPVSLAGLPALTLPDGRQMIGKPFSEGDMLNFAYEI